MMQALLFRRFGGPDALELVRLPRPEPGPGAVPIRVALAGVNFADLERLRGTWGSRRLPQVMGVEVVGVREDTGVRVVALLPEGGAYAEHAAADPALVFPVPDGVDDATAVALFEQGLTAHDVVRRVGRVAAGESVAVHAAAGGVGGLAVQLARLDGAARVVALASTPEKRALALALGAHEAIDGAPEGLEARLLAANEGRPLDVVLDSVGGAAFAASLRALAPFGRLVTYGSASGEETGLSVDDLGAGSKGVLGYWLKHTLEDRPRAEAALCDLFALAATGRLRPVLGATVPLADAPRALRDLAARRTVGKLFVDPRPG